MNSGPQPVLVCFAVEEEAKPFRAWATDRLWVKVVVSGMGAGNATRSVQEALSAQRYAFVLTCGFAGGLDPSLKLGTVVFSSDAPQKLAQLLKQTGARPAQLHCVERVITSAAEKKQLRLETKADAVEMESGVVCHLCRECGIPSATVRVILDSAEEDLPLDFNLLMDENLKMAYSRLALLLARSPAKIPALIRLRRHTNYAARQLADVLCATLDSLPAAGAI